MQNLGLQMGHTLNNVNMGGFTNNVDMGGFTNLGWEAGISGYGITAMAGGGKHKLQNLGLQMGSTGRGGSVSMGGFTDLGLQMGHTQNLFDWKKAAGEAEKGITFGAKTWCQVHGC